MLNFLVQLVNEIGVPVVLVGTYKALPILTGELRQARRGTEEGDMIWHPMQFDKTWDKLLRWIWKYQYTRIPFKKTPALSEALYDVSQGITDFALKAYMLAQKRAIHNKTEEVTADLIRSVVKDELTSIAPALAALRSKDKNRLRNYEDVYPFDLDIEDEPLEQEDNGTVDSLPQNVAITTLGGTSSTPTAGMTKPEVANSTEEPGTDPSKKPLSKHGKTRERKQNKSTVEEGLPTAAEQGRAQQIPAYEALKQAGFIGHPVPPVQD